MKAFTFKYAMLTFSTNVSSLIILLLPFHAFLTVWISTWVGHYTALRLWKEVLLLLLCFAVTFLILSDQKIRKHTLQRKLAWLIFSYILLQAIFGFISYQDQTVTIKSYLYGLLIDIRFLLFFLITWAIALRTNRLRDRWTKLIFWPATVVIIFGVMQILILPNNFLIHFGYGPDTIAPFQTINSNQNYIRIQSTLRGVNPLGAYMLLIITFLTVQLLQKKRQLGYQMLFIGSILVSAFTFSRSSWIGTFIACMIAIFISLKNNKLRLKFSIFLSVCLFMFGLAYVSLQHNYHFQNVFWHTQTNSPIKTTSDEGHLSAIKYGLEDVANNPMGQGAGSAGPASVYNENKVKLAENYYIQLAQEGGIIAVLLFMTIVTGVGYILWTNHKDPLSLALFASLIGISIVNLFWHTWTDDTLAYVWWGMAGIAMVADKRPIAKKQQ